MEEASGGKSGIGMQMQEEEMDVGECSEDEEEEEDDDLLTPSPSADQQPILQSPVSGYEGLASPLRVSGMGGGMSGGLLGNLMGSSMTGMAGGGKPAQMRRGPGRPRTRGGSQPSLQRPKKPIGLKLKRWKGLLVSGVLNGSGKPAEVGGGEGEELELPDSLISQPLTTPPPLEPQKTPVFVDEPLFPEQWPGKVCVMCNLSEYSQLGQGEMLRVECCLDRNTGGNGGEDSTAAEPPTTDQSPRQQLFPNRRVKGGAKHRNSTSSGQEPVDELSLVGYLDVPETASLIDQGYIFIHEWCAGWCAGVVRGEDRTLSNLAPSLLAALSRRCYYCSRFGAGAPCVIPSCNKYFHTPCAAAASAFQHPKTRTLVCSQHIDHVPTMADLADVVCHSCDTMGNVGNLVMCSSCGNHHHGGCIGNTLHAGLRAGWQCPGCRLCQLCRSTEETNRMLVCDHCDKAYHLNCMRPVMSSVPKVGWKCKRCRLCSDCGARTPGGGLSSRWHSNYTVCDSCYQQRNKGFSCPICHKAYRAPALREMVRCSQCQRFVHGTCDGEADFVSYHRKKEAHPDYQYICIACKNNTTDKHLIIKRKDSTDDPLSTMDSSLTASQESLNNTGDELDFEPEKIDQSPSRTTNIPTSFGSFGLGKGKPFCASKIAKKKLGLGIGPGRPKGTGKMSNMTPISLNNFQKKSKFSDFGKRRGVKPRMRGIFGFPGLGLQKPTGDSGSKSEEEPPEENKIVLCSSKDKFVLGQDMCVMCGSLGIDQEACLIACTQCGQCYHPYCVSVKVTKVMLQRGWRCLDCTVCEGCGLRNDEGRLILCDECDISYHIYCMDPPLGSVPSGVWKCKWCAVCQTCGSSTPGVNSVWQNNYTECGPCCSRLSCPACYELYTDGDLIIKCANCERWVHCGCDSINNEMDAELVCSVGYMCLLCRPHNQPLIIPQPQPVKPPTPEIPVEVKPPLADYCVDGVCLSELGLQQIKSLTAEQSQPPLRRRKPGMKAKLSNDSDILATIESVVCGDGDGDNMNTPSMFKDGMIWGSRESGIVPSPPEGFSLHTMDSGVIILKRKKQRNLQKLGIGGFSAVKLRTRFKDEEDNFMEDKPKRKPRCNKKRSKLAENYPSYLLEAFFGQDLMITSKDSTQDLDSSSDESEDSKKVMFDKLSQEDSKDIDKKPLLSSKSDLSSPNRLMIKEEEGSDSDLKDILRIPDILQSDLVNTIINNNSHIKSQSLLHDSSLPEQTESNSSQKDELSDILGPNFNLETMVRETGLPTMDSKDVEEIFKGVLTDESQESVNSSFPVPTPPPPPTPTHPLPSPQATVGPGLVGRGPIHSNLSSPVTFPSASPYNSEYSNSPQMSPDASPWSCDEERSLSVNQRTWKKMESDEVLGQYATISAVLYANMNHPEWRTEFPSWGDRCKQILKKWRTLPADKKAPYLQQAKENRAAQKGNKKLQDQDKGPLGKANREFEQERQWKQMQAIRQQGLIPQRAQVTRKVTDYVTDGQQTSMVSQQQSIQIGQQLQLNTGQEVQVVCEAGGGVKVVRSGFTRPVRPPLAAFSPPRPPGPQQVQIQGQQPTQLPPPPSPHDPDMNRQLRDLLQRHNQVKQGDQSNVGVMQSVVMPGGVNQLRHVTGTRLATPASQHQPTSIQNADARIRLLLQAQQRGTFTTQTGQQIRLAAVRSPLDQFTSVVQKHQQAHPLTQGNLVRPVSAPSEQLKIQPPLEQKIAGTTKEGEELPDSVTAELEKLEQEGGTIAEADAVSAIFGDLVEDDDELLAEMGTDFNILAYADPELENVTGGEKTNILDVELEDEDDKKKNSERVKQEEKKSGESLKTETSTSQTEGVETKVEATPAPTRSTPLPAMPATPQPAMEVPPQVTLRENSEVGQTHIVQDAPVQVQFNQPFPPPPPTKPVRHAAPLPPVGGVVESVVRGQGVMQAPPPPPYPGPPPPYPGQEQPLLLEELLEEEKREQEKQVVTPSLMSDDDFERLRAEVKRDYVLGPQPHIQHHQHHQQPVSTTTPPVQTYINQGIRLQHAPQHSQLSQQHGQLSQQHGQLQQHPPIMARPIEPRVQLYQGPQPVTPPPQVPPDVIITEQDRQIQIVYENWLYHNNRVFTDQLKHYETEIAKLRKMRKSLNSKQRQLRKNGNELSQNDAMELQRVTAEQAVLQKHLEAARKQSRQHNIIVQEYQAKHEPKPEPVPVQGPQQVMEQATPPQSPMLMSPVLYSHPSPAPTPPGASPHSHHSPRTDLHLQLSDDKMDTGLASPRPPSVPSNQQYQIRHMLQRFARSPEGGLRPRLQLQVPAQQQQVYSVTSPGIPQRSLSQQFVIQQAGGPPMRLSPQQQQQLMLQRQQQLQQQKQMLLEKQAGRGKFRQQSPIHSSQSPLGQQCSPTSVMQPNSPVHFPPSTSPMHSPMIVQYQGGTSPRVYHSSSSPMQAPQSPMVYSAIQPNSPLPQFNQPISPMPPQSPRIPYQPPSSPCPPTSPMMQQQFRPSSPMPVRRSSSSLGGSPASERPHSTDNSWAQHDDSGGGGGGPNMMPLPEDFVYKKIGLKGGSCLPPRGYYYRKIGLRGGAPMWSTRKPETEAKPQPTPPSYTEESSSPKAALIDKTDSKTRQSEDTDSELTVYEDIVLVGKESNLEEQELKSALQGNVMSSVVSMPMVIDSSQIQMMNVGNDLLVDSESFVMDIGNGSSETDCILGDKDGDSIMLLDDDIDNNLKEDDVMDIEEDSSSPPAGRKRMTGKVLPGQSIIKEDDKPDSDSPDEDSTLSPQILETVKPSFKVIEKSEVPNKVITKETSNIFIKSEQDAKISTTIQPNVVIRTPVTFTPVITQKSIPVCNERQLSIQQATVASLVDNAVKAAQQQYHKNNSVVHNSETHSSETFNINKVVTHNINKNKTLVITMDNNDLQKVKDDMKETKIINSIDTDSIKITNETIQNKPTLASFTKFSLVNRATDATKPDASKSIMTLANLSKEGSVIKNNNKNIELSGKLQEGRESYIIKGIQLSSENSQSSQGKFESDRKDVIVKEEGNSRDSKDKLPGISSSILEAQLTASMLRSSDPTPPQSFSNILFSRPPINETKVSSIQTNVEQNSHDEIKVEGLAAHFQRCIENEENNEFKKITLDDLKTKSTNCITGNIFVRSEVKSDTLVVDGKSYKIYQATPQSSTSDILNLPDNGQEKKSIEFLNVIKKTEEIKPRNTEIWKADNNKIVNSLQNSLQKQVYTQSLDTQDRINFSMLQQRVVSSSQSSDVGKETHFLSFKDIQKEDQKKFLPLTSMIIKKEGDNEKRTVARDDSQNVLLKKLLQNTACASSPANSSSSAQPAPAPAPVLSLEAQLARPVPPTPSSLIPPVLAEPSKQQVLKETSNFQKNQIIGESSEPMVQHQIQPTSQQLLQQQQIQQQLLQQQQQAQQQQQQNIQQVQQTIQQQIPQPALRPTSLDKLLSPQTQQLQLQQQQLQQQNQQIQQSQQQLQLQQQNQQPIMIKKELQQQGTQQFVTSPVVVEVKKEIHSSDEMLSPGLKMETDLPSEMSQSVLDKKAKRRQYHQKRRQSLGKDGFTGTPKKRARKSSKVEEDYDSFIDTLMVQLRQTPSMSICEPNLTYNFTACPVFGSGDLCKISANTRQGDLKGLFGNASVPNENDYYNTLPYGDVPPRAPSTPSTQRGFYNEEFSPLKLHAYKDELDERKFDYNRERDNETPDTVVSSSSPECVLPEIHQPYPGLRLIDSDNEEEKAKMSRYSPDIPIVAPLAIRAKPIRFINEMDKENEGPPGKRNLDGVTVTLTLNSSASDDVMTVLRNLANFLRIPIPANYCITDRLDLNECNKLGLYRVKPSNGSFAGGLVDVQSILNGGAKFCRWCDTLILHNIIRKRVSDMPPQVAKDGEPYLYFCSSNCYKQTVAAYPPLKPTPDILDHIENQNKRLKTEHDIKKELPEDDYRGRKSIERSNSTGIGQQRKSSKYRVWTNNSIPPACGKYKKLSEKEITEMLFKMGITVMPAKLPDDTRACLFCHQVGDGVTDGPARLLNYDVNKWVHLNCALWSDEVYETQSGGLMNVEQALQNGMSVQCHYCQTPGATLKCYKFRCSLVYHLPCAIKDQCVFYKNKTLYCCNHVAKGEKENELTTLSVMRRVFITRDENRQVASVMQHNEPSNLLRVGSLVFLSVGQLLPHQLANFHTPNYIYPVGYKIVRMYWSMRVANKRCKYICSIGENDGRPEFRIVVQERGEPDLELKDVSARAVWMRVLEPMAKIRVTSAYVQLFHKFLTGEDLFGLTEPAIVRILESLPGIETLADYRFKYGRNPLLELPLAINPTGCARSESRHKMWKKAHTQRTTSLFRHASTTSIVPTSPSDQIGVCPYSKQFVHSKSSQYKKMKQEWRNNVFLARSKIQGLGLYAARDLEKHTMVIEYIGELIRSELAEIREKQYEAKNRGVYMFRLDEDRVVDATISGGLARYINHSCSPNCVAESVEVERDLRIIIFTKRRINRGEELAYDYKFDIEDESSKIPCMCGAPNCRKWMN